jgi:nitrous oxidase accessory protein NosD
VRIRFTLSLVTVVLATLAAAPFAAAATRTWVSGVGDDANPCSRTAPCKTFAGAISKTQAGGEINVIDGGGYGGVTITKSITISGVGGEAGVLVSGTHGIVVNAGANDRVLIRGLDISGINGSGLSGIKFIAGKSLIISRTDIWGFANNGITMAGAGRLSVRHSEIDQNGLAGIWANPSSGIVRASITDSVLDDNNWGLVSGPSSRVSIQDSQASGNLAAGFMADSGGTLNVLRCLVEGNATGLQAQNSGKMRVASSEVTDNDLGLNAVTGGQLISRGDNTVEDNTANGSFTGTYTTK